ncbi:MAG: glycosyl transferase [Cellulophaga sp.]
MKVFKELPNSIYYSCYLRLKTQKQLIKNKKNIPVIVSLTSIPSRLNNIDIVIKSIFNQTIIPEKIILWLHTSLKDNLPKKLYKLQSNLFEIKYSNLTCSHRKLIHSLKENPDKTIVTCDDDQIYRNDWLELLYDDHLLDSKSIIAHATTQIKIDENDNYLPFIKWRIKEDSKLHNCLLPIGAWGILYPPNSMSNIILNEELFLKLTPKADDLWFKGMSLLNNTISKKSTKQPKQPIPIIGSQKESLQLENVKKNKNEIQWQALSDHFDLISILKSQ